MRIGLITPYPVRSRSICLAIATLVLVATLAPGAWAMGKVKEEQVTRFDELRAVDDLTCEIWHRSFGIEFDPVEGGPPLLATRGGKDSSAKSMVLIFDDLKTRVLQYIGPREFLGTASALGPPEVSFGAAKDGAILLPPPWESLREHQSCFLSLAGCRQTFEILADPAFADFFPIFGGASFRHWPDLVVVRFGRCRPGIDEEFRRQAVQDWTLHDNGYTWRTTKRNRYEAACGDLHAQKFLAAQALLLTEPFGEDLVEAYSRLRIAFRRQAEIEPYLAKRFSHDVAIAIDIAAERMTSDQIARAERRAAAWQPDPGMCLKAVEEAERRNMQDKRILQLIRQTQEGDGEAQYQLSNEFFSLGIDAEAIRLLCLSANQRNAKAQAALADRYRDGTATGQPDLQSAYLWYALAASNGSRDSEMRLKVLAERMSGPNIADAQRLAAIWEPDSERCEIALGQPKE